MIQNSLMFKGHGFYPLLPKSVIYNPALKFSKSIYYLLDQEKNESNLTFCYSLCLTLCTFLQIRVCIENNFLISQPIHMGQDMTKGILWLCQSKSSSCCLIKVLSLKSIPWKFEAVILNIDKHMEVWSNIVFWLWNVTSRRTLNLIWHQIAGLQLLVGYCWLGINI